MEAYAVVETGGKQYRVQAGDVVEVEKLAADVGSTVELDQVLAVSDGTSLTIGTPRVDSARVVSTVIDQTRGDKIVNFKKKRRKGYRRKIGHRQDITLLKIERIAAAAGE
jgi:large subunit ribosomal protein L21